MFSSFVAPPLRLRFALATIACLIYFYPSQSRAATFASGVIAYVPGNATTNFPSFTDPNSALGAPAPISGVPIGFPNVLSPFSPAFDTNQIVVIGAGGHLTLKFPVAVNVGSGPAVGVISNVGLIDISFPSGQASNPAAIFGGGSAAVSVSQNGVNFVSLGSVTFDIPADYFTNAGPFDSAVPASPLPADFGLPFTGTLSSFDGQSYSQIITTLNGSGGGKWLDLSSTGLSQVNYIDFAVPASTDPTVYLTIDSVAIANGHAAAVPIPPAAAMGLALLCIVIAPSVVRRALWR